jgi:anti-sigma B factor antagonist
MVPTVDVSDRGQVKVAAITGDLELFTVEPVAETLDGLLVSPGEVLVLDLQGVTFLDSSGLSLLVALNRRVSSDGGELRLVCLPATLRLLTLTSMDQVLRVYGTMPEALSGVDTSVP